MNYHKIDICNMNNGDGLRVVLWVSGCNHYCHGCFNQQTWDVCGGDLFESPQIDLIKYALSQDWCSGITFSGGDPLFLQNRKTVRDLCILFKKEFPSKNIWIYTGYTYEELINDKDILINDILSHIDILVDGLFIETLKSPDKYWVGSSNQRVIDMQATLKENKIILYCD